MTEMAEVLKMRTLLYFLDCNPSECGGAKIARALKTEKYAISRAMQRLEKEGLLIRNGRTPRLTEEQNTLKHKDKPVSQLSGGQKQRVWIAMALAQDTRILFLDEPTTYLDIRYQLQILKLIKQLNREYGITIVMVLHDINQSLYYSDEIIAMKDGKIIAPAVLL